MGATRFETAASHRFTDVLRLEQASVDAKAGVVRGVANTFNVMRSGRMIHPDAARDYLARTATPRVPLLAQHGEVDGFATIGRVTKLTADPKAGLRFEAKLVEGTKHADEARKLIAQGALSGVSIGWASRKSEWATVNDRTLDPHVADAMKRAGATECNVHREIELVEISLVDVPDDPGALLAARARGRGVLDEHMTRLMGRFGAFHNRSDAELVAAYAPDVAGEPQTARAVAASLRVSERLFRACIDEYMGGIQNTVADLIESTVACVTGSGHPTFDALFGPADGAVFDDCDAGHDDENDGGALAGSEPSDRFTAGELDRLAAAVVAKLQSEGRAAAHRG